MIKIKTLMITSAILLLTASQAFASSLDSLIQKSQINKTSTIAVSVKDAKSGRVIYQFNEHKLMNPASVQKIFTMKSAYDQLGKDYTFNTAAYIDNNSNLYIKLGADPSLSTSSLKNLFISVSEKYNKPVKDIVIDPSIIDNKQWGIGWMWDDDTNSYLPKYSPFSINENKIDISIEPGKNGRMPEIKNKSSYSMTLVNLIKNGSADSLKFERQPWQSGDMTYISGTIKNPQRIKLPVDSPERHFNNVLKQALSGAKIKYTGNIKTAPLPPGLQKVGEINSVLLSELTASTLKNSNNFYSEMIFKTAASDYTHKQGTTEDAVNMFNKYYSDIKSDNPIIVDACGISRNNLLSADWITEALNKIYHEKSSLDYITLLPKPIEGTLSDRLLDISLKLRAKTGTASGISSIAGYIDTKSGKKYSFAILIQNFSEPVINIKRFEDSLIQEIYKM